MTAPLEVLSSASAALKVLSKLRCVESYSFDDKVRYKVIRPWPSTFEKSQIAKSWFNNSGLQPNEKLRVQAYPVTYSDYEKYTVIKTPGLAAIRAERNVIVSAIIATLSTNVERIACIWDMARHPKRTYPSTTSDFEELKEFSLHKDSMLGFKFYGNDFYYKVPAFVGSFIFEEAGLFKNQPIEPEDMRISSGKNTDHMNRTKRSIVHEQHMGYLESVFGTSLKATRGIVSEKWANGLRTAGISYYEQKDP